MGFCCWSKQSALAFRIGIAVIILTSAFSDGARIRSRRQTDSQEDRRDEYTGEDGEHPYYRGNWSWPHYIMLTLFALGAIYALAGLVLICKNYFAPVLEALVSVRQIQADVVGGTFMAGGLSMPILLPALIGPFISRDDTKIGDMVGYSSFNILFVLGISGLLSGAVLPLTSCPPFFREGIFYTVAIIGVILSATDSRVQWWEAVLLIAIYVLYLIVMTCNRRIRTAMGKVETELQPPGQEMTSLENDPETGKRSLAWPKEGSICQKINFVILFPLNALFSVTLPDVSTPRGQRFLMGAYIGCIIWIVILTDIMLWFVNVVRAATTRRSWVPLTWLVLWAVGPSLPHLLTCGTLARRGHGDMILASVVAFAIFNFLVVYPLGPFMHSLVFSESQQLNARGVLCSGVILFVIWILLLLSLLVFRWRLTKGLGALLIVLFIFVVFVLALFEFEVFHCSNTFSEGPREEFQYTTTVPPLFN